MDFNFQPWQPILLSIVDVIFGLNFCYKIIMVHVCFMFKRSLLEMSSKKYLKTMSSLKRDVQKILKLLLL